MSRGSAEKDEQVTQCHRGMITKHPNGITLHTPKADVVIDFGFPGRESMV